MRWVFGVVPTIGATSLRRTPVLRGLLPSGGEGQGDGIAGAWWCEVRRHTRKRRLWPHWWEREDTMQANVGASDLGGWIVSSHAPRKSVECNAREEA